MPHTPVADIDDEEFRLDLANDEGTRRFVYQDTRGFMSIGIGRNLSAKGLHPDEITLCLSNDIAEACTALDANAPWWRTLDLARRQVLANMAFNLGWAGLSEFQRFLLAMQAGDWQTAADEMQHSQWWTQVGARAVRLRTIVLTGARPAKPAPPRPSWRTAPLGSTRRTAGNSAPTSQAGHLPPPVPLPQETGL